jgi:hypothetical protein
VSPSCEAFCLPILGVVPEQPLPDGSAVWHPRLDQYAVSLEAVTVVVTADRSGFVRLAHPWFPSMTVRVNGVAAKPIEGALHLVVLPLQPGTIRIEITPFLTPAF